MSKKNINLGRKGEDLASNLLKQTGYRILCRNYKTRLGEIDIIAKDKDTYCFIEVKTRNSLRYGDPVEAVSHFKQRQMSKAALMFLKDHNLLDNKARFDVISVVYADSEPKLDLIKNAFDLEDGYAI